MADHVCLEWGNGDDLAIAEKGDTISFPHVDSCLAIVLVRLDPYKAAGGHAAVTTKSGEFGFKASLAEMIGRLKGQFATGGAPNLAVFVGGMGTSENDWPVNGMLADEAEFFKTIQHVPFNQRESVDVLYATKDNTVTITEWKQGGGGKVLVAAQPIFTARRKSHAGAGCVIV